MPVRLAIESRIRNYEVHFEESGEFLNELALCPHACFVVDENVWSLYGDTLLAGLPSDNTVVMPVHEGRKNLTTVQELYDRMVEIPAKRNLTLISIGGGILQDVTGFAASTLYRGVNWIYVPTTLLAQADSCIGSKTSLNYGSYKNLLGTFFPPNRVHIYPSFLNTLTNEDFYSGYGEVIKLHIMGGKDCMQRLLEIAPALLARQPSALLSGIRECLNVKLSYMCGDEFDMGRRNLLNYGHDFGHALRPSNFEVPHGQAVIFGMIAANRIACKRGLLPVLLARVIDETLLIPSLVIRPSADALAPASTIAAMKRDKKRTSEMLALIVLDGAFNLLRLNDVTPSEVEETLTELSERLTERSI